MWGCYVVANLLVMVGAWVLSSFLLKLFTTLGIGFMTYKGITFAIDSALSALDGTLSAIPADILQLFALSGGGEALSIIGSALVVTASVNAARVWVGTIS